MLRRLIRRVSGRPTPPDAGPGPPPPVERPRPAPPRAWSRLPPIARVSARPLTTTAGAARFSAEVAATVAPQRYLAPLGHDRDRRAPRGTVSGVLQPSTPPPSPADGDHRDELPLLAPAHARPSATAGAAGRGSDGRPAPDAAPPAPPRPSPVWRTARHVAAATPVPRRAQRPPELSYRTLAARTFGPLPHEATTSRPLPTVEQQQTAPRTDPDDDRTGARTADTADAPRPTVGARPPLVDPPALRRSAGTTTPPRSPHPDPAPRPGLGAPLRELPGTARPALEHLDRPGSPSVSATGRDAALAAGMAHLLPAPAGSVRGPAGATPAGPAPEVSAATERRAPTTPALRVGPPVRIRALDPPVLRQAAPTPPAAALAGQRPLVTSPTSRPTFGHPDGPEDTDGPTAGPVPVRWSAAPAAATVVVGDDASGPPSTAAGPAPTVTSRSPDRLPSPEPSAPPRGRPGRLGVHRAASSPTAVPVAARPVVGPTAPVAPAPPAAPTPGAREAGPRPAGGDGRPRARPGVLPVARMATTASDTASAEPTAAAASAPPMTPPTTPPAAPAPTPAPAPVQRALDLAGGLDPPQPAAGGASASDPDGPEVGPLTAEVVEHLAGHSSELAALARRLYPQLRDELRWELRVHRERAGLLSDPL